MHHVDLVLLLFNIHLTYVFVCYVSLAGLKGKGGFAELPCKLQ